MFNLSRVLRKRVTLLTPILFFLNLSFSNASSYNRIEQDSLFKVFGEICFFLQSADKSLFEIEGEIEKLRENETLKSDILLRSLPDVLDVLVMKLAGNEQWVNEYNYLSDKWEINGQNESLFILNYKLSYVELGLKNYDLSIDYLKQALVYRDRISVSDYNGYIQIGYFISPSNTIGYIYKLNKDFSNSLNAFYEARSLAKKLNETAWTGIITGNIAAVYAKMGIHKDSLVSSFRYDAVVSVKTEEFRSASSAYSELASLSLSEGKLDEALVFADSSIYFLKMERLMIENDKVSLSSRLKERAQIFSMMGRYNDAFKDLETADSLLLSRINSLTNPENKYKRYRDEFKYVQNEQLNQEAFRFKLILAFLSVVVLFLVVVVSLFGSFNKRLKLQNEKILTQSQKLEQLNSEKNKLIGVIAHDVRTPLSNLNYIIQLFEKESISPEETKLYVSDLKEKLTVFTKTFNDMVEWALVSLKSGVSALKKLPIDIEKEAKKLVCDLKQTARIKEVTLLLSYRGKSMFLIDKTHLNIILRNLISNAIKFSNSGGLIKILLENEPKGLTIKVIDQGVGMTKEEVELLLKADNVFSKQGSQGETGSGLGTKVVAELVTINNGSIYIESEKNRGTTVNIFLPA
jgi:two-component system sensor histidine kinase/response regulator